LQALLIYISVISLQCYIAICNIATILFQSSMLYGLPQKCRNHLLNFILDYLDYNQKQTPLIVESWSANSTVAERIRERSQLFF